MTCLMLGIDTATPDTTVGIVRADLAEGEVEVLAERRHRDARRHGEVLPGLITEVLHASGHAASDVEAVAVGVGPGAYTGLRVGIATAQALSLVLAIPVTGVVTLDAIALASERLEPFAVVTDARRREVFMARYHDCRTPDGEATVGSPDLVASIVGGLPVLAPPETPPLAGVHLVPCAGPSGAVVCGVAVGRLRDGSPTAPLEPMYLRRPDVAAPAGPKSVL
ncbi:MAG: tRNA (adenosine(37)-N6)-threonylcarbamoyltransferase complex dimerization subunit type 1 TsaB [Actinomycetes bacterium]